MTLSTAGGKKHFLQQIDVSPSGSKGGYDQSHSDFLLEYCRRNILKTFFSFILNITWLTAIHTTSGITPQTERPQNRRTNALQKLWSL
jgi:hypothetical protein